MDDLQKELNELKGFIADLKADRAATKEKEKRDAWTKYVSLTIVVMAVLASVASLWSGKYGGRVQNYQMRASDTWNLYQARSIKGHLLEVSTKALSKFANTNDPEVRVMIKGYESDLAKYNAGKAESQKDAQALEKARDDAAMLGGKLAPAVLLLPISIALSSMCLLTKKKSLWFIAMITAAVGSAIMFSVRYQESLLPPPPSAQTASAPATPPHPNQ